MTQQEFDKILDRFFSGNATNEDRLIIEKFYDRLQKMETVHHMWIPGEKEKLRTEMLKSIRQSRAFRQNRANGYFNLKIAASLTFFLVAVGLFIYFLRTSPAPAERYITKSTGQGQRVTLTLDDGTVIKLNSRSSISFPETFSEQSREVQLSGEAFFEVKRDVKRPFIVKSGGVVTMVLGTSFNINAYLGGPVAVTVATGKVSVVPELNADDEPMMLTPNQQAVYDPKDQTTRITRIDHLSSYLAWKNNTLNFEMTPFAQVVKALERRYDIDISMENDMSDGCLVRATYKDESLENVLNGLKLLVNFDYEFAGDGGVKITGKGCENQN